MTTSKQLRELKDMLEPLGLRFEGKTRKGHLLWRYKDAARRFTSVRDLTSIRTSRNVIREAKHFIELVKDDERRRAGPADRQSGRPGTT